MKIFVGLIIIFVSVLPWCVLTQNSPADYLKAHNDARAEVGVKPLKWNTLLESYAHSHLSKHIEDCDLENSGGPYGENIVRGAGIWRKLTGKEAVDFWVSGKKNYDEKSNTCIVPDTCLGYTQVVWNTTIHVGCARVKCHNGSVMVSCNYDPPGNFKGQRPY
ncbi:hypothetical protein PIB30_066318 [Stylosanthes scabra]|uniref:SCP domain-containing protein n=1 Tax=Stylosanthes scabra TaxID=79078 RepID=A0ABU6XN19_9FABA|nr:hypothetical protein [Stylosanthes scabra]